MLYEDDIKEEYLSRLATQSRKINEIVKVLDYKNNRDALTDEQVNKIAHFVNILEHIKDELLNIY